MRGGTLIGQQFSELIPPRSNPANAHMWERVTAQPLAEPKLIGSREPALPSAHSRWGLFLPNPSVASTPPSFKGEVAILLTYREIDAYFAYQGITNTPLYDMGILIRGGVDMGAGGLVLSLDVAGHNFDPNVAPGIATYFIEGAKAPTTAPTLSAQYLANQSDTVAILLSGNLPEGDHLVLLQRDPLNSTGTIHLVGTPPTFVPPPTIMGVSGGECGDCELDPDPNIPFYCPHTPPVSEAGCPAATLRVHYPGRTTKHVIGKTCKDASGGPGDTLEKGTKIEVSVTTEVGVSAGGVSVGQSATGSVSESTAVTHPSRPFGAGSGCGECHAWVMYLYYERFEYIEYKIHPVAEFFGVENCMALPQVVSCRGRSALYDAWCDRITLTD